MSIGVFSKRVGKRTNIITPSIHPNIHITPGILINGLGYITALPCPFKIQQLYPESFTLLYIATVASFRTLLRCLIFWFMPNQRISNSKFGAASLSSFGCHRRLLRQASASWQIHKTPPSQGLLEQNRQKNLLVLVNAQGKLNKAEVNICQAIFQFNIQHFSFSIFQRNSVLPMMYRRHMRFGSFSSR